MNVEWDPQKAEANLREHEVSFAEAATVLEDDLALTREDPDAVGEARFVTLGMSGLGSLLVVVRVPGSGRDPHHLRLEGEPTSEVEV